MILLHDEERVACGCHDEGVIIVNVRLSEIEMRWSAHQKQMGVINVGKERTRIASGSHDKTAKVWDVQNGLCVSPFDDHSDEVILVAMSQDGKRVVCDCCDGSVHVWDIESGLTLSKSIRVDRTRCWTCSSSDGRVLEWDLHTRHVVGASEGQSGHVLNVTLMPYSECAVTRSMDGIELRSHVRIWDLKSMKRSHVLPGRHGSGDGWVFVSDDGKGIISVVQEEVDCSRNETMVWYIGAQMQAKRIRKDDAYAMSRRQLLSVVWEGTLDDEAGLSIRRHSNQMVHGEGSEGRVLGSLDASLRRGIYLQISERYE